MAVGLRKIPHVDGAYSVSGTLAGIEGPGRRIVTRLELRRLGPDADLSILAAFEHLETLELERVRGIDLAPLAGLRLTQLTIRSAAAIDLTPLASLPELQILTLVNFADVRIAPLRLAGTLRMLGVGNDDPDLTGAPVKQVIEALDWDAVHGLQSLSIRIGGLYEMRPVEVDMGFLRSLPNLVYLDAYNGFRHVGPRSSPIEPPFDGLSKHLRFLRVDAWEPEPLRAALQAYLGIDPSDVEAGASVVQRYEFEEPAPPWSITEVPDGGGWCAYGSLLRDEPGEHDDDTEYDAARRAMRRIRDADRALLKRLEFDPESAGTGIGAVVRDDLETALGILGLG